MCHPGLRSAALLLLLPLLAPAQSIQTVAGGTVADEGRLATLASVAGYSGTFDAAGNLLFADNNRIRKVSAATSGITTVAGNGASGYSGDGGPATQATLSGAFGVAVDRAGNVYFCDVGNATVRKITPDGIISTVAGTGTPGRGGENVPATQAPLSFPTALAIDASGRLLVADAGNNRIRRIDLSTGLVTTFAGTGTAGFSGDGGPATQAQLKTPLGIAVDPQGNVVIADRDNQRVRRVARDTERISTIAGNGTAGSTGDGGDATQASLNGPSSVAVDGAGNVAVSCRFSETVRRITPAGRIDTVAGNGQKGFTGDGVLAIATALNEPSGLVYDASGNLFLFDLKNFRIRRIDGVSNLISTFAGNGSPNAGDGGPAIAAGLAEPLRVARDAAGNLYIANTSGDTVKKVAAGTGILSTIAGTGVRGYNGDGILATTAQLAVVGSVAVDGAGNVYLSELEGNRVRRIDAQTGLISTVAGTGVKGYSGDGGQATQAQVNYVTDLAVDASGVLYLADFGNTCVRRVVNGTISRFAGVCGSAGFSGDGGAATQALLAGPAGLALDASGGLLIADQENHRIRLVAANGTISTVAGNGTPGNTGDGGPAGLASFQRPTGVGADAAGNLYVADRGNNRVRRIAAGTRFVSPFAGTGAVGFTGDGGAATLATFNGPVNLAVSPSGDVFIADQLNGRIRSVLACVSVAAPDLQSPPDGASGIASPAGLAWSAVPGAYRYDLYLDTVSPPARLLAADLTATAFSPANLSPGVRYYWKVVAKGDPFCLPLSTRESAVRSFALTAACDAPAPFAPLAPADGATGVTSPQLSWQAAPGAGSYDLYLGPSSPPALFAANLAGTTFAPQGLAPGSSYSWFVVAKAACDPTRVTSTPIRVFTVTGGCGAPGAFALLGPADGATGVAANPTLSWSGSSGAASYDLYLGTTPAPPLFLADLTRTSASIGGLAAGARYYWKVVAKVPCDGGKSTSSVVARFDVGGSCVPPAAPGFTVVPPGNVGAGQTYVLAWSEPAGIDAAVTYRVERSRDASFASLLDTQETTARSVSFTADSPGTYHHRVRAVRSCGAGSPSGDAPVVAVDGAPNVVFSVAPGAVLSPLGEKIEDRKTTFTLENLSSAPLSLGLSQQYLDADPVAFFVLRDPQGGRTDSFVLEPRKPRTFEVRFTGVDTSRAASYQGIVVVQRSSLQSLAIVPYGYVNLKVGAAVTVAPEIVSEAGAPIETAFFPGFAGDDDTSRPGLAIGLKNSGSTPMELAAEVAPEVWLEPEKGWNAQPIPPGATRTVRLFTRRSKAPNGSALPRYTYVTFRTKGGASARLLVQDSDVTSRFSGRASSLPPGVRSFLVPSIASVVSKIGGRFVSKVRITNVSGENVQTSLVYTPNGADGFSSSVQTVTVVVPPNDAVTLTDPVVQLFGLGSGSGALEVRAPAERAGSLNVTSGVDAPGKTGGSFGFQMPVVLRGEGAKLGRPHAFSGVRKSDTYRSNLILAETTGLDAATVLVSLYDADGQPRGSAPFVVPRYGQVQVSDVIGQLDDGVPLDPARLELTVTAGGGTVVGVVTVIDNATDDASTLVSQPITDTIAASAARERLQARLGPAATRAARSYVVPAVVSGYQTFPGTDRPFTFRSAMTLTAGTASVTTYRFRYYDTDPATGAVNAVIERTVTVPPRATWTRENVLEELFGIPAGQRSQGPMFIEQEGGLGQMFCRVYSLLESGSLGDGFPVVPLTAESLTGAGLARPIYIDGLEQSTTPTRGTRSNLILTEVSGQPSTVSITLFEAGNRSRPIGQGTVSLKGFEKKQLSTVFKELGLDSDDRRKDRTNVMCLVTAMSGNGLVSAVVTTIDNRTGDTRTALLTPAGGVSATGEGAASIGF